MSEIRSDDTSNDALVPIRVLLVDDHRVVVQGIHAVLSKESGIEVVGEAASAEEALAILDQRTVDVVLTDISLPRANGVLLAQVAKTRYPGVHILALTVHTEEEFVVGMIQAGADGYVNKSISAAELIQAIRLVAQGQVLYPAAAKKLLVPDLGAPLRSHRADLLTDREREVLRLIAMGATSREIARQLFLSAKTVDNHRARILEKLQARNKAEAVAYGIQRGFISPVIATLAAPDGQLGAATEPGRRRMPGSRQHLGQWPAGPRLTSPDEQASIVEPDGGGLEAEVPGPGAE